MKKLGRIPQDDPDVCSPAPLVKGDPLDSKWLKQTPPDFEIE